MNIIELSAQKRTAKKTKNARKLRKNGHIPAILYGHKLENIMLSINESDFERILNSGMRMINLTYNNTTEPALVKDVQYNMVTDEILHIDLSRISLDKTINIRVPIILFGEPVGVKEGGVLTQVLKDIEIECLPSSVPEDIKVDISELGLGNSLFVKELPKQKGIEYLSDGDTVVASVHHATEEKEVLEEELETETEPEVISKKAKEEAEAAE